MPSSRLLAVAVLLSSSLAFAQTLLSSNNAAVASQSPKMIPNKAADGDISRDHQAIQFPKDKGGLNPDAKVFLSTSTMARDFVIPPFAFADGTCFAIRSYVVARDSKHSDSTHPVGYSTCVPANKYRIRKADDPGESGQAQQDSR